MKFDRDCCSDFWMHGKFKLIDLDTGAEIPHVLSADDETGHYRVIRHDDNGFALNEAKTDVLTDDRVGNIKLVEI